MLFVKLTGDVEQAGTAFENSHRRAIVFNVHKGGHTAIRIYGRVPLGLGFTSAHVQVDIVVWNASRLSVMYARNLLKLIGRIGTYQSSSAAMVNLTGFTDAQP